MKYLQAFVVLFMLVVSRRYRQRMVEATECLSEACDFCDASLRRIAANENGGKPAVKVIAVNQASTA